MIDLTPLAPTSMIDLTPLAPIEKQHVKLDAAIQCSAESHATAFQAR
jgi:hypothetical protein